MGTCSALARTVVVLFAISSYVAAQANQTVIRSQDAPSLSGTVIGADQPMANVAVAECSVGFKECKTVTHTGDDGRFVLHSDRGGRVRYLRFVTLGWCEERETITVKAGSKSLVVRMIIGT